MTTKNNKKKQRNDKEQRRLKKEVRKSKAEREKEYSKIFYGTVGTRKLIQDSVALQRANDEFEPVVALLPTFRVESNLGEVLVPRTNFLDYDEEVVRVAGETLPHYYNYWVDFEVPWEVRLFVDGTKETNNPNPNTEECLACIISNQYLSLFLSLSLALSII
jgi:hypothetical protein